MIPYRRGLAIDSGAKRLLATDVTIGDVILIRRPGAVNRTPETVSGIEYIPYTRMIRIHLQDMPAHVTSRDMPVSVQSFTSGSWRQYMPWDVGATL